MAVAQRDIPLVAMEAGALQQLIAVASIGFLGTFCYAVASFGRAIVIHMVWGSLALFMPALGTDQSRYIDLVTLITLQGVRLLPFALILIIYLCIFFELEEGGLHYSLVDLSSSAALARPLSLVVGRGRPWD